MPTTFPHATLPQHVPAIPALLPPPLHLAQRGPDGGQVPIFEPIRVLWEQSGEAGG